MQDPYSVLGVSPSASDDEIKKAYRALAKKYHPDVNNGSSSAEMKMKEINEAYSAIMKMRREGTAGDYAGGYGAGGYGTSGFGGFHGYGGFNSYGSSDGSADYGSQESRVHMQAARNFIHSGHHQEAMNLLEGILERTAEWYYLAGEASYGLGNRVAALTYARQAVSMDPMNFEYRLLLNRLEVGAQSYQHNGATWGFGMPGVMCASPMLTCCLSYALCNCCCGGRGFICC